MNYRIGAYYDVPCVELRMVPDGRVYHIPVIDYLHADAQFGFPEKHYHVDGRFEMDPRMLQHFRLDNGHTYNVIVPDANSHYIFKRIISKSLKCVRLYTGLNFPQEPNPRQQGKLSLYQAWYKSYVGKVCEGKRCPHFGTEMLEKDGMLVCPLHNLTADPETLLIVPSSISPEVGDPLH
jgi:hypothetical protein